MDLFEISNQIEPKTLPLAERLRPQNLEDFVGQRRALDPRGSLLSNLLKHKTLQNLLLWGPPGTGKTTFAHLIARHVEAEFINVNAVETGAKKLRELGQQAHDRKIQFQRPTILFVDEIHRLNKAQQDVLLPFAEKGDFTLVGATTENPGYEINAALLSRMQTVVFERLETEDLKSILARAFRLEQVSLDDVLKEGAIEKLLQMADGDARQLLNLLEQVFALFKAHDDFSPLTEDSLKELIQVSPFYYDKNGDEHFDCTSALIKSIRGSDPDAGVYYLARMLEGGEDPIYIARRLVVLASEDVGNADPRGLSVAVAGLQAVQLVGLPEAAINLSQVVTYLACAPKSNRSYEALKSAQRLVKETGRLPIPKALRSAQTRFAKEQGHGKDYRYSHSGAKSYVKQEFLPQEVKGQVFYHPLPLGFEKNIIEYQKWIKEEGSP